MYEWRKPEPLEKGKERDMERDRGQVRERQP